MRLRIRIALLLCLAALATYTGTEAVKSLKPAVESAVPEEIYTDFLTHSEQAEYYLGSYEGFVAVYAGSYDRQPQTVTAIEVDGLRAADRAMLQRGIPVVSLRELLTLLEDLGS